MAELAGFPYFEVQFTKKGKPFDPGETEAVLDAIRGGIDDLFVVSHGWNNDIAEARVLYRDLFGNVRRILDAGSAPALAGRKMAVLGVLWPSKQFAEEELISGGGASLGGGIEDRAVQRQLDELKGTFDRPDEAALEQAKQLVPDARAEPSGATPVRRSDPLGAAASEGHRRRRVGHVLRPTRRRGPAAARAADPARARPVGRLAAAARPGIGLMEGPGAAPGGGAAGIGDFFSGIGAAARRLLNYATYYQMKERAGQVGMHGLHPLLRAIRTAGPDVRIHLIGHSFGGRVVTAAAARPARQPVGRAGDHDAAAGGVLAQRLRPRLRRRARRLLPRGRGAGQGRGADPDHPHEER